MTLRSGTLIVGLTSGLWGAAAAPMQPAGAQQTARVVALPAVQRLATEQGLSHQTVYAVHEDPQGFLWFGTQSGLNRFDGRDFVVFGHDPNDTRSLGSSWINTLSTDRGGSLLVGTRAGLYRLSSDGTGFEHIPLDPADRGGKHSVTALAESADGTLWVGTDGACFAIDQSRTKATALGPVPGGRDPAAWGRVRDLRVAPDGAVWALTEEGPQAFSLVRISEPVERYESPYAWAFGFTGRGEAWVDPRHPVATAALGSRSLPPMEGILTAHLLDARGRLWVGTLAGLFVRPSEGALLERIPLDHLGLGALTHEVTSIIEDRVGTVWLGTYGGVLRFDPKRKAFARLVHREGDASTLASNAVSAIYQEPSGKIWIATFGAGLDEVDRATGRIVHHPPRPGDATRLGSDYLWDLAPSDRVTLWAGSNGAFYSLARGRFRRHTLPAAAEHAFSLLETQDGTLWLGTNGGLYRYLPRGDRVEFVGNASSGLTQPIDTIHDDRTGRLWLGSAASGDLAWYEPATGAHQVFRRAGREGVWDLDSDSSGTLWMATGGGIASVDRVTGLATYVQAAATPTVYYSVLPDRSGRLWLGTSRGLVRYDPATGVLREYEVGEGTGHVEFNRHAAYRGRSGELFFGGMNGVTSFVAEDILDNDYRPPVVLTAVRTFGDDGERRHAPAELGEITLSPRDRSISLEFAALNFTDGRKNRYTYRLDDFDPGWIDAGMERTARYTSLPPGRYVFRVRGSNNDGIWSDREIALSVRVLPPFRQTWWFRASALALVLGGLALAYRLRLSHLAGLERLRLRIAGDLHDDLGSELSGIALASGLVARQPELAERDRRRLTTVSASAVKVMDGLRDIIWCISPDHDTIESMEQRMRLVAHSLLVHHAYEFHTAGLRRSGVEMGVRRHLFLIYKELVHNIVRHAGAGHVRIALEGTGDALRLTVTDDGRGAAEATADGSGLRNIRRRAQELGADLRIDSEPGQGTTISVLVPMTKTRRGKYRRAQVG